MAARAHVDDLFATDVGAAGSHAPVVGVENVRAPDLPVCIAPPAGDEADALTAANATRHDWIAAAGWQDRSHVYPRYVRTGDLLVRTTDPDATYMRQKNGMRLGYQAHYVVDGGKARIILAALLTPAEVPEDYPAPDLFWRARFRWRIWPRQATGDKAYGTIALIRALEDQGAHAYIPLPKLDGRTPYLRNSPSLTTLPATSTPAPKGRRSRSITSSRPRAWSSIAPTTTCATPVW